MQLYLSYRQDDSGFALSVRREVARLDSGVELVSGAVRLGETPPKVPPAATVLMLVGTRWLRPSDGAPPYWADENDPQRRLIDPAMRAGRRVVPVLLEVTSATWGKMCRELPAELAVLNAVEVGTDSFSRDVRRLLDRLAAPDTETTWTESEGRTLIQLEAGGGGALKWYSGRDKAFQVFIDGKQVGALRAWGGEFDYTVAPGQHTVQVRVGGRGNSKSKPFTVEVKRGRTAVLVCERNILTAGPTLHLKG